MNNNYYNYRPNASFIRNVPFGPVVNNTRAFTTPLPRISSLFSGARGLGAGASFANAGGAVSKISFSSILNGASKTLGVINQAIPVFYQVKPIWNNAKTMFRVVREMNTSDNIERVNARSVSDKKYEVKQKNEVLEKEEIQKKEDNSPTFFI